MAQDSDFTATFGPYQIRKLVGSGRIASVFDAVAGGETGEERPVALKVFAGRVRRDVELSPAGAQTHGVPGIRVQHDGLVQMYEVGRVGDNLFLSMESIDGPSLERLLTAAREGGHPLEPHVVMTIAMQLAAGLRALHGAEVGGSPLDSVHGDLRPSNVLLTADGQVKITGWGVAELVRAYSDLDEPDRPLEPPLYVSPEQSREEELTAASDVFSWGVVILELIAGKPLFDTPTVKGSIRKLRGVQLKGPFKAAHKAFPELAPILERAVHKSAAERYADGKELYAALKPLAPPETAQQLLSQLVAEVRGDLPDDGEPDDELMDRVSHFSEEESDPSISSFVLPPSDPVASITPLDGSASVEPPEEPDDGSGETDDLTATDEIGVTEEIGIAEAASSSLTVAPVSSGETPQVGEKSIPEERETDDGEDPIEEPDATETLPSEGVPAGKILDPDLEASAFNLPSTDDDFLETTVPPVPGSKQATAAKGEAAAAGRKTGRVFQGNAEAGTRSAKRGTEKVTVWTGTSGRPETVAAGDHEEKPSGAKWFWIVLSVAAVALLVLFVVSELTPSRKDRGAGEGAAAGGAGASEADRSGAATAIPSPTDDAVMGLVARDPGEDGATGDGAELATEAPLLDPSILGPDVERPDDGSRTPVVEEAPDDGAADPVEPEEVMAIQHAPVGRGIRGRAINLSVAVEPPGSYQAVIWYRASGGPWNQAGARGGADGTLSGAIPHGSWLGDDSDTVEYYIEVVGVAGTRNTGSAVSPHSVKIY